MRVSAVRRCGTAVAAPASVKNNSGLPQGLGQAPCGRLSVRKTARGSLPDLAPNQAGREEAPCST